MFFACQQSFKPLNIIKSGHQFHLKLLSPFVTVYFSIINEDNMFDACQQALKAQHVINMYEHV